MVSSDFTQLPDGQILKSLKEGASYKFLGILQSDWVMIIKMEKKIEEYI